MSFIVADERSKLQSDVTWPDAKQHKTDYFPIAAFDKVSYFFLTQQFRNTNLHFIYLRAALYVYSY